MNRTPSIPPFSREDTNFLKGIAILLVVLHNYYRWINPMIGENEFEFASSNIVAILQLCKSQPLEICNAFFTFLGHYGILLFIVISAYGLTLSFKRARPAYGRFLRQRFVKIYPSLVLASVVFVVYSLLMDGRMPSKQLLHDMLLQATLLTTLLPGKAMIFAGPWWFYSFIFQFYLVFPLLFRIDRQYGKRGLLGVVLASYCLTIPLYAPLLARGLNPYQMVIGHLPEFCLGIYLAGTEKVKPPPWALLAALLIAIGGNVYRWLWPFANLAVALLMIAAIQGMLRWREKLPHLFATVSFVGLLSMYLFACHGYLRWQFIPLTNRVASPLPGLLIGFAFVAICSGVAYLMMRSERFIRHWIQLPEDGMSRHARFLVVCFLTLGGAAALMM